MSQDYTVNSFQADHVAQTDMANIEKNLECLRSFFSGAIAPSNLFAGHVWWDTSKNRPKIRNDANTAWLGILIGSIYQKFWVYRNDTEDGWAVDSSITDRVLALKGGTGLYNTYGGYTAGESWANLKAHTHSIPSHAHAHNHQWYDNTAATEHDNTYLSNGTTEGLDVGGTQKSLADRYYLARESGTGVTLLADSYTNNDSTAGGSGTSGAQSTADVRPAAAVGTLQYPDL